MAVGEKRKKTLFDVVLWVALPVLIILLFVPGGACGALEDSPPNRREISSGPASGPSPQNASNLQGPAKLRHLGPH